jgi:glucose uptake protein
MFAPETLSTALIMMITSTICWGSWANSYKLTKNYRFEHFYWDYSFGIFIISLILALSLGSSPSNQSSFLANIHSADTSNVIYAMVGGFIFNIANLLLVAGIEIAGLAVAFPLSIGIALVLGVVMSYAIQPKGDALTLACGVAFALLAVILIGKAYGALPGTKSVTRKGTVVCVISGLLMGSFAPFVTRALTAGHTLTPYSIAVFFTLGALVSCAIANSYLMRHPLVGEPVNLSGYFKARPLYHVLGLVGGFAWGLGTVFNFVAASLVGVAVSYAIGQASPMIAVLWGVFVWHEFKGSAPRAKAYLGAMVLSYLLALIVISHAYK